MLLNGVNLVAGNLGQYIQEALDGAHDRLESEALVVLEYLALVLAVSEVTHVDEIRDALIEVNQWDEDYFIREMKHYEEYGELPEVESVLSADTASSSP